MKLIVEHKTATGDISLGSFYWAKLALDIQISGYLIAIPADGVLYNVLRKIDLEPRKATPADKRKYTAEKSKACPECKRKNSTPAPHTVDDIVCSGGRLITAPGGRLYADQSDTDETPDEYYARCLEEVSSNPEKYYQRVRITRLSQELRDARDDLKATAEEIDRSSWPRNTDACTAYGKMCEYWPVCSRAAEISDDRYETRIVEPRRLPMLSASSAKTFRACPRKYYFANVLRRRAVQQADALTFGSLIHKLIEGADVPMPDDPFAAARATAMMVGYRARWPVLEMKHEQEFEVELIAQRWNFGGRADGVAEGEFTWLPQ